MPGYIILLVIAWIITCVAAWVYIRNRKPEMVGLGRNTNDQKIDGVTYEICQNCGQGALEPKFKWWQYCFGFCFPPGIIYIYGSPHEYQCSNCAKTIDNKAPQQRFTRLSLSHKLTKEFFIAGAVTALVALGLVRMIIFLFG